MRGRGGVRFDVMGRHGDIGSGGMGKYQRRVLRGKLIGLLVIWPALVS